MDNWNTYQENTEMKRTGKNESALSFNEYLYKQIGKFEKIVEKEKEKIANPIANLFDCMRLGIIENMVVCDLVARTLYDLLTGKQTESLIKAQVMTMPMDERYRVVERNALIIVLEVLEDYNPGS